jgi:DNA-directed RNA polymerase subunit K/omega
MAGWQSEDDELFLNDLPEEEAPEVEEPVAQLQFLEEAPPQLVQRIGNDRLAAPTLDQFAKAALFAARAAQISLGDQIRIPKEAYRGIIDLVEIVQLEMNRGVFPLKIIRTFADGTYEEWSVYEFDLIIE